MNSTNEYSLLDSGRGKKLEQFGPYSLIRPCAQAVWEPQFPALWKQADATFTREGSNGWQCRTDLPESWTITCEGITFSLAPTDFGHIGIFPEQKPFWRWIQETLSRTQTPANVLNLFAYSGGSTLAAAKAGASVCHLDASKAMISWARENAALNELEKSPVRWIIDDALKFLKREKRRERSYDAIILDPPTFGRGSKGEVFKIEKQLNELFSLCNELLSPNPLFVLFSCHTPGFSPTVMHHFLSQSFAHLKGNIDYGEMLLTGSDETFSLPSGTYARWTNESLRNL